MDDPIIRLTYDGGDAASNAIDMRLLGLSLQGADRITSDGRCGHSFSRRKQGAYFVEQRFVMLFLWR